MELRVETTLVDERGVHDRHFSRCDVDASTAAMVETLQGVFQSYVNTGLVWNLHFALMHAAASLMVPGIDEFAQALGLLLEVESDGVADVFNVEVDVARLVGYLGGEDDRPSEDVKRALNQAAACPEIRLRNIPQAFRDNIYCAHRLPEDAWLESGGRT